MIRRDRQRAGAAGDRWSHDEIGLVEREPADHQIDLACAQLVQRVVPSQLDDLDLTFGMQCVEGAEELEEARPAGRAAEHAEPDSSLDAPRRPPQALEGSRQLRVRGTDLAQYLPAERSQLNPAARPVGELGPELCLQPSHALADSRGRELQPLRGPREMELLGQGEEDA